MTLILPQSFFLPYVHYLFPLISPNTFTSQQTHENLSVNSATTLVPPTWPHHSRAGILDDPPVVGVLAGPAGDLLLSAGIPLDVELGWIRLVVRVEPTEATD